MAGLTLSGLPALAVLHVGERRIDYLSAAMN